MKKLAVAILLLGFFLLAVTMALAQDQDAEDAPPDITTVQPPPDLRNWTPLSNQFQLYVNFNGRPADSLTPPWIDILDEKLQSCAFWMEKIGDTLYLFIIPPGYALKDSLRVRNTVNGLDAEFPMVVWAGNQRASYWFSYDSNKVVLDTLQPAAFVGTVPLKDLPPDVLTLQLEGKNKNAKILRALVKELKGQAVLVQLDEGFYRNIWFRMTKTVVQTFKTNETKTGTLLAFRCTEGTRDSVAQVLAKLKQGMMSYATDGY